MIFPVDGLHDQWKHGQWGYWIPDWSCHQQDLCLCKTLNDTTVPLVFNMHSRGADSSHNARLTVWNYLLHQLFGGKKPPHSSVSPFSILYVWLLINHFLNKLMFWETQHLFHNMMFLILWKTWESGWKKKQTFGVNFEFHLCVCVFFFGFFYCDRKQHGLWQMSVFRLWAAWVTWRWVITPHLVS